MASVLLSGFFIFSGKHSLQQLLAKRLPELVPVTLSDSVGSRCLSARAVVRAATATTGIVALISHCLVRLRSGSVALPATLSLSHFHRARKRASAVVPLCGATLTRWLAVAISAAATKHSFWCGQRASIADPEPVNFECDLENWAYGPSASDTSAQDLISARISFFCTRCNSTTARLASQMCGS